MKLLQKKKYLTIYILAVFAISAFFYSCATTSVTYPTQGWQISTPEEQGMQSQLLAEMMERIQYGSVPIDSILIIRNGYMVLDAYFWPFSKGQKHNLYSCTKSIMSALIGIAIDKGYIQNIDQPIMDFFPDKEFANMDGLKKSITVENLLMMASGLKCTDSYLYNWAGFFEMKNSDDWVQYVLDLPMAEPPGEWFEYCNGVSYLLSVIIQNTTKMKTLDFARKHLFEPLDITDVGWETNPQGVDVGYGEMWLQPQDMAKFGWLYLNKGRWGDRQILPSAWVEVSTRGYIDATLYDRYGYQWWVDNAGFYMAVGHKGQFIFVVPDKDMVVVFTSDLAGNLSNFPNRYLDSYIIPAAVSSKPLPSNRVEKARLDGLQASMSRAPTEGFIWISEKEGVAKNGVFERTSPPSFKFEYPVGCKKTVLEDPGQVMGMKTPEDVGFSAFVIDIPDGIKLEDFGPKVYAPGLEDFGSNIKVISNNEITLKCGTKAYRTNITWLWDNNIPITTFLVSAYKNGKIIFLITHPTKNQDKLEPIVQSLTLK